jgi:hypothetical protein
MTGEQTAKILLGLTALMGLVVALVAYVAFLKPAPELPSAVEPAPQVERGPAAAAPPRLCDSSSFAAEQCPVGQVCIGGLCESDVPRRTCGEGEPCDACECEGELVCYLHRCRREPPPPSEVCLQPTVHEAMTYLARECNRAGDDREAILSTLSCSADDWKKLAIDPERLDAILAAFPDRVSVHFAPGAPRGLGGITGAPRQHYVAALREQRDALASAKQVLIIGRSSPDGDPEANYELALRRIDAVTGMIREVLRDGAEGSAPEVPLRAWSLASENPLTPSRYRNFYARSSITSSASDDARLTSLLGRELDPRHLEDWRWLYGTINRVVLVIPIPCDGTEWDPAELASFQGDPRDE